ncbi:hypothetical protein [Methanothrix harundinacea]|uniref:ATP-binding protein n=1 Tax=Methanothrix harundinacea (strain 6Ac) TaxID=1110509 RepID=G7WMZ3_METH6|nr:hypothetical protein [Methanothrix harundinacea]AET64558.1 hypothetical protein Mhar_1191 [Methanothrix harundinacea 6Ac]
MDLTSLTQNELVERKIYGFHKPSKKQLEEEKLQAEMEYLDELMREEIRAELVKEFEQKAKIEKLLAKQDKRSATEITLDLILNSNVELWQSEGEGYITFELDGHLENHPIRSKKGRLYPAKVYYESEGKALNKNALELVLTELENRALFNGKEYPVFLRVGKDNDGYIYHDLCNENWEVVRIGANGVWLDQNPPIKFIRSDNMKALPYPKWCTIDDDDPKLRDYIDDLLNDLWMITNLENDYKGQVFFWSALLGALKPDKPYPVLFVTGEKGSAKSSFSRIFGLTIDPKHVQLVKAPTKEQDLYVAAKNNWILSFDNSSGIPAPIADAMASIATGGGFTSRELYSDNTEKTYRADRLQLINGIGNLTHRPDLLDRALHIHLKHIPQHKRLTEREINKIFEELHPKLLSLLYATISNGLYFRDQVCLECLPRMADFALWICECLEDNRYLWQFCMGEEFLDVLEGSISDAWVEIMETDAFTKSLAEYITKNPDATVIQTQVFYEEILDAAGLDKYHVPDGFPKAPKSLWSFIERSAPVIREALKVDIQRSVKENVVYIIINRLEDQPPKEQRQTEITVNPESNEPK